MQILAIQKNVRQSPRKVRLVANEVKDLSLEKALRQLAVFERRASLVVLKVLKQAIANAMNNHQLVFADLQLKSIEVLPGAVYKRWQAVSRGRAHGIKKRTSHIKVVLETQQSATVKPSAAPVAKKETKEKETKAAAVKPIKKTTRKTAGTKKVSVKSIATPIKAGKTNISTKGKVVSSRTTNK